MKEFGSDFHTIDSALYNTGKADLTRIIQHATYLASGRQGLILIIRQEGWKRLWVPEYFCYEVLDSLEKFTDIELVYYSDYPGIDSHENLKKLPYKEGDALLRMNYFGLIEFHKEKSIPVPVVEDHSHDLLSRWALFSDADWCVASLRKTMPLAEGGVLWSPKGKKLMAEIKGQLANEELANIRWQAMDMKNEYLGISQNNEKTEMKKVFRELYIATENALPDLDIASIDNRGMKTLRQMDLNAWYNQKKRNWKRLTSLLNDNIEYLIPKDESCTPFSLVLKTLDIEERERIRQKLVQKTVYPAVLWRVPEHSSMEVKVLSDCLLSIHCDGRYSEEDMDVLANIINEVYQ